MWSGLPQLPTIGAPNTGGDSWNLNRRRHFITPRQVRPQGGALTQVSFRSIAPSDINTQLSLQNGSPDHMVSEDAELIREVYETHANRFFEDLRGDMMKQTAALVEQTQLTKKPPVPPDPAPVDAKSLQDQVNSLWQQVQDMQKVVQEMQKAPAKGIDHDAVRALCTEVVHRVLAERGPLLNEQHLRPLEIKLAKLEQSLETKITYEIQELRVTSSRLVKRVNSVAATSGQLDERIQGLEKERQRVGTARADEWMSIARRQLEDFGNNLKSAKSRAADPAAEELLSAMQRARAALESGQKARESLEQAASSGMGLAVMWGKGDMMQMHACLQEEDVRGSKPMALPAEADSLPILIEETSSPTPAKELSTQGPAPRAAHDLDCLSAENVDQIKAKACMALEGLLLGDDWRPEEEDLDSQRTGLHPKPPNGLSPDKVNEIKAKACMALEGLLLGDDWLQEDDEKEFIEDTKAKACMALEGLLLGDDWLQEDDEKQFVEDTKAKACMALEGLLLGDDWLREDDEKEFIEDTKAKACMALEGLLLGDDWNPEEDDRASGAMDNEAETESQRLAFLVEQKAKARAALESLLLGDDAADFEDDEMEFIEDTKARARAAVESVLLGDLGDLFADDDDDDEAEAPQDVDAIKRRAQEALELALLEGW